MSPTQTVVVLGGSLAGLHVAHGILKKSGTSVKVIVVSKNAFLYWNLAAPRAIIPSQINHDALFTPLEEALKRYPDGTWEVVVGTATTVDFGNKAVSIETDGDSAVRTIGYDQLVLATGARAADTSMPWKASGSYTAALESLQSITNRVKEAQHILVAGAGGTGIEVAGELGYEYGKTKEIHLLSAGPALAGGHGIAGAAAQELKKLGVRIHLDARVESVTPIDGGRTEVVIAGGELITTDLYLPTTGLVPNTDYVPDEYLVGGAAGGRAVKVDQFLRVQETADVWACGDVVSQPRAGLFITQKQAGAVVRNVLAALEGRPPTAWAKPPADIFACAVGRKRGVGRINNSVPLPSFLVWLAKGRTLGMDMIKGYIDGSVAS